MVKVRLYLVRHGKTMFNTIGRAQGWSDTPLTAEGERGIQELGIRFARIWSTVLRVLIRVILGAPFRPWELSLMNLAYRGKSLIAWTSVSENGVLVALMVPTMGTSLWELFHVFSKWITSINCPMLNLPKAWSK